MGNSLIFQTCTIEVVEAVVLGCALSGNGRILHRVEVVPEVRTERKGEDS